MMRYPDIWKQYIHCGGAMVFERKRCGRYLKHLFRFLDAEFIWVTEIPLSAILFQIWVGHQAMMFSLLNLRTRSSVHSNDKRQWNETQLNKSL